MKSYEIPKKSVVYVMDAYCGWCWGFSQKIKEFEAANHAKIPFSVLSGGLFLGDRVQPIAHYAYIAEANKKIEHLTGAVFGNPYQHVLHEGQLMMNSLDAAKGFAALRAQAPERAVVLAHALHQAFFDRGLSLSDPQTIVDIAAANDLDTKAILRDLGNGAAEQQAKSDFLLAYNLGVKSYPTLLLVNHNKVHALPATGASLEAMNQHLADLLH